ncbi:transcription factor 24 [Polymixia lowei]
MAENPLESLMSISVNDRTISATNAGLTSQQVFHPSRQALLLGHKQSLRSGREPRKWSGSGSRSNTSPGSGGSGGSMLQARVLRSQHSPENAARERSRVRNLRQAFHSLQAALPSVPPDTKLSKLDVLVLATNYIAHLTETLDQGGALTEHTLPSRPGGYLHPVKKWPMRSLLYCGSMGELLSGAPTSQTPASGQEGTRPLTPTFEADPE